MGAGADGGWIGAMVDGYRVVFVADCRCCERAELAARNGWG